MVQISVDLVGFASIKFDIKRLLVWISVRTGLHYFLQSKKIFLHVQYSKTRLHWLICAKTPYSWSYLKYNSMFLAMTWPCTKQISYLPNIYALTGYFPSFLLWFTLSACSQVYLTPWQLGGDILGLGSFKNFNQLAASLHVTATFFFLLLLSLAVWKIP